MWRGLPGLESSGSGRGRKVLPTLVVGDEDQFHRQFRRGEDMCCLVGLFMVGNKSHVPRRDPDEGRHVAVAANCGRFPRCVLPDWQDQDHQKRVSRDSEEASAWRTSLSISFSSYSGLAIHEPVQRYRNKSVIAQKISSSGKAERYEIPPVMEQLRGLPKSSLVVRNVHSNAC